MAPRRVAGVSRIDWVDWYMGVEPKIRVFTPNHPFVHRVGTIIFTIHFGGFPTIFGNTHICDDSGEVYQMIFIHMYIYIHMYMHTWQSSNLEKVAKFKKKSLT